MNNEDGNMTQFASMEEASKAQEKAQKKDGKPHDIFAVGEFVQIKKSWFKVVSLGNKFMRLQIVPTVSEDQ